MPIPSSRIVFAEPPSKDRTTITQRATALTPCNSDWGDLFAQRPLPAIVLLESKREVESKREADRR